jgi:hypothetical protein
VRLELPDPATGILSFSPSGTALHPHMLEDSFLKTAEGSTSTILSGAPPDASYKLRDAYGVNRLSVGVVAEFSGRILVIVRLFIATGAQDWGSWSETEELQNRDELERLLASKFGKRRTFPWGTVLAAYDPRSGSSALSVRYA